jgi:hypothetical protein
MPQRRKRAAARKGKQKRGKTPKKKTAKHLPVKTMPKKRAGKAKPRTAKKAAARKPRPRKQQGEAPAERQTMGIAITLAQYLGDRGVAYDLVPHPRTVTTSTSAAASRGRSIRAVQRTRLRPGHARSTIMAVERIAPETRPPDEARPAIGLPAMNGLG